MNKTQFDKYYNLIDRLSYDSTCMTAEAFGRVLADIIWKANTCQPLSKDPTVLITFISGKELVIDLTWPMKKFLEIVNNPNSYKRPREDRVERYRKLVFYPSQETMAAFKKQYSMHAEREYKNMLS